MQRGIRSLLGLALLLAFAPLAFSQEGSAQPCPDVREGSLGCQLVAWSHLQDPVPLPQPETKPAPPPDQEPGQSPDSQAQPQASKQSISGIIVRQGEKYVLKAGDNTTYQLDDQEKASRYQNKQVTVVGRLDAGSSTFHVESIELAS
jgi:hypothetical protein